MYTSWTVVSLSNFVYISLSKCTICNGLQLEQMSVNLTTSLKRIVTSLYSPTDKIKGHGCYFRYHKIGVPWLLLLLCQTLKSAALDVRPSPKPNNQFKQTLNNGYRRKCLNTEACNTRLVPVKLEPPPKFSILKVFYPSDVHIIRYIWSCKQMLRRFKIQIRIDFFSLYFSKVSNFA